MKVSLLTASSCLLLCSSLAVHAAVIKGKVISPEGKAAEGVSVMIDNTSFIAETDKEGNYQIPGIPSGSYSVSLIGIGYSGISQNITIAEDKDALLDFVVKDKNITLDNVTILGLTEIQEVNKQAYNVTTIDAKKLYNSTLDLSHALDRMSGIRVRESGGVGSNANFSLNGFTGNQVRFFLDGIPMDNFGSSFQINNIPINFAERVEVYKGSVPVWLGSDALGGAVNIITGNRLRNYIDASYSYGSFNTHRTSINAAITSRKGFTAQFSAFQNYSDNNYKVTLDVADIQTGAYTRNATVRRFHDQYHNETFIANFGVIGQSWADKLLIGVTLGNNRKEIQTGARMTSVFGSWHTKGNIIMPTLKYQKKNFLTKGLDLTLNANYNLGKEQSIDTAFRRYDWYGNYKEYAGTGGERSRTMYRFGNNTGLLTTTLFYTISEKQTLAVNNVLSSFNRKGFDQLFPEKQANAQPQKTLKNVTGLSYKYDFSKKWTATVFGKMLHQNAHTTMESNNTTASGETVYIDQYNNTSNYGYGVATSYYILPQFQAKFSFEKSNRLPENYELFGDNINQESNFSLRPERSKNFNLGLHYAFGLGQQHNFMIGATGIYRYADDYIYFRLNNNQSKIVADNLAGVSNIGGEMEVRYSYKNLITIEANATYQDIRNQMKYEPGFTGVSAVYKDRIPNMPFLFGHTSASFFLNNLFTQGDNLSFGYNLLYVHAFYLYWPSRGNRADKHDIPMQLSHDINAVYTLKGGRYNIGLECKNITDAKLYDNFSLQKPGRAFYIKLRYFYSK